MTEATEAIAALVRAAKLPAPAERRRIRKAAHLSLEQLGAALGVSATAIWHWENGRDGPSLDNAVRYRKLLDELKEAAA